MTDSTRDVTMSEINAAQIALRSAPGKKEFDQVTVRGVAVLLGLHDETARTLMVEQCGSAVLEMLIGAALMSRLKGTSVKPSELFAAIEHAQAAQIAKLRRSLLEDLD